MCILRVLVCGSVEVGCFVVCRVLLDFWISGFLDFVGFAGFCHVLVYSNEKCFVLPVSIAAAGKMKNLYFMSVYLVLV